MQIIVAELTGPDLARFVALAEGLTPSIVDGQCLVDGAPYAPHENWSQGGPILDREDLCTDYDHNLTRNDGTKVYRAWYKERNEFSAYSDSLQHGTTTLEAAMRCRVARAFGAEFEQDE